MVVTLGKWAGRIAVITGANAGMGAAVAARLQKEGMKVVGLDINTDHLDQEAKKSNGKLYPIKTDITKEKEILTAFKIIKEKLGPIQVLINCAGVILKNSLIDGDTEKWKKVFDTNVMGLCICTREAISNMKEHNIEDGHIIHFSSIAAHNVISSQPEINVYPATKHAIKALTEMLRIEMNQARLKIKISSISPGHTETTILSNLKSAWAEEIDSAPGLLPDDIAEAITYMLSTPPHVQIHDMIIKPMGEKF